MITGIRVTIGFIGCAVSMLLYAAPILTFKRVIKEATVGEFSCIPYILTLFSCLIYCWYGLPVVSSGWENLTVAIISITGLVFEMAFISIYLWFAPREKKKQVMRTKSVKFMPFYLSLFSFLTSLIWLIYGILGRDTYIMSPNCAGCLTGILQLVVYCIYSRCKEATKTLNDIEQKNDMEVETSSKYTAMLS
nr:sugar transporter protein SWEET [Stipagrostis pennata]